MCTFKIQDSHQLLSDDQRQAIEDSLRQVSAFAPQDIRQLRAQVVQRPEGTLLFHLVADWAEGARGAVTATGLLTNLRYEAFMGSHRGLEAAWAA